MSSAAGTFRAHRTIVMSRPNQSDEVRGVGREHELDRDRVLAEPRS